ncbi:MAG: RnfABCDGE type electron transport complex subunit B [Defluviitaleaceae bacterium]|nr:RnfABCDGE type electron transport complex subunit B [Defluviitaleaceae bacterium]
MTVEIFLPIICVGALALVFGALLGFSAKKFEVKDDPKISRVKELLPGVNCGNCGFPGCAAFAKSVVAGAASYKDCPAAGVEATKAIADLIGADADAANRKVAFLPCNGVDDNVVRNYLYDGPKSCVAASQLATGGNKSCRYSCIGLASCQNACPFDAIKMVGSIAEIDRAKCTGCGKCVAVCPKDILKIVPDKAKVRVLCHSMDTGKLVRKNCRAGCIGCRICQNACPENAITLTNNLASIDYEKCTQCLACVSKCPAKAIKAVP